MSRPSPLPAALEDLIESGLAAQRSGNHPLAAERYAQVLALAPNNFDALQLLGLARLQADDLVGGIQLLQRALQLEPAAIQVLSNLGTALRQAGAYRDSVEMLRRALRGEPNNPVLLSNLALTLIAVGELATAGRCIERAAGLAPENPIMLWAFGQLMQFHNQPAVAAEAYRRAIARGENGHDIHHHLGLTLQDLGDMQGSWEALRAAEARRPTPASRLFRAYAGLLCARWDGFEEESAALAAAPEAEYLDPFRLQHFLLSGAQLRRRIERYTDGILTKADSLELPDAPLRPATRRERVRIAYLSPDFREHPVGALVAGMLPEHDRGRFEIRAYAWGPKDQSGIRARVAAACDHFEDVDGMTHQALIAHLRAAELDIAVDLCGFTGHNRLTIFGARIAPVQVNWLGYPGTTGVLDYICADGRIIPPGHEADFSEQVVRLPHTYLPYDRGRPVGVPRDRSEYGLPDQAVVLACFGQLRKLNPLVFDAWMQVLREAPQAILWLSAFSYPAAASKLREAARARGVDPARLVFAAYDPDSASHLARYRVADLMLDTYPYGSHSTAADALWAGCPLVSLAGDSFGSRVSGSILAAAGLPELAARSIEEYTRLIQELAVDGGRRAALRARLAAERDSCPLFDTPRFVRSLETAFQAMHEQRLAALPPRSFDVREDGAVHFAATPEVGTLPELGTAPEATGLQEPEPDLNALVIRGLKCWQTGRSGEAAAYFERALALQPDCFDALQLLGALRVREGQLGLGIQLMQRACVLKADHAPTLNNLGNALVTAHRLEEGIDAYRRAIEAPDAPVSSYFNLGHGLVRKGDAATAYRAFSRACELDPTLLSARGPRASLGQVLADWTHADADAEALLGEPQPHDPATVDPGALLSLALPAAVQRRYADAYARFLRESPGAAAAAPPVPRRAGGRPLRVGYLSADLRGHAVGYLLAPVFEAHDPSRVSCFAYSWSSAPPDATRTRIQRAVVSYREVTACSDAAVRTLMAEDEIDIAVDLMGHTALARPSLYARRVAPAQVGWLGYPGTMGKGMLDWLIADAFIIPPEAEPCYAESILRLPGTYLPYDPKRAVAAARTRAEYGLPATALVLASLGPVHKIAPQQFRIWMEVLRELPEAVLWLGHMAPDPLARLRGAARSAGIDPARLFIAASLADNAEHLARYQVADLVLDTFPYGAHSTAADALHVGCPIVARVGDSFASRVSGSILSAAGLPELITHTAEGYQARVLELARDAAQRRVLRERIAARRATCPLFDLGCFVRALEDAFERIHRTAVARNGTSLT